MAWHSTPEHWREDCLTAALHELGRVIRDPYSGLEPSWLDTDLDLDPLHKEFKRLSEVGSSSPLATFLAYSGRRPITGPLSAMRQPRPPSRSGSPGRQRGGSR